MEEDLFELWRQARKRDRAADGLSHPFGRDLPPMGEQLVFDDGRAGSTVLIVIPGATDSLGGVPPVSFFELIDAPVRRVLIRKLWRSLSDQEHPLGRSTEQVQASLRSITIDYPNVVFFGSSIGAYMALLHGSRLGATTVITTNPTATLLPELRATFKDSRMPGTVSELSPSLPADHRDIPTLWKSHRPGHVIVHYPYRDSIYRHHAEHLAGHHWVKMRPYYEYQAMHRITSDGSLKRTLDAALSPLGVT
jgi:hypothetical protein